MISPLYIREAKHSLISNSIDGAIDVHREVVSVLDVHRSAGELSARRLNSGNPSPRRRSSTFVSHRGPQSFSRHPEILSPRDGAPSPRFTVAFTAWRKTSGNSGTFSMRGTIYAINGVRERILGDWFARPQFRGGHPQCCARTRAAYYLAAYEPCSIHNGSPRASSGGTTPHRIWSRYRGVGEPRTTRTVSRLGVLG